MAQTTILAAGVTAAASTDVVVASGSVVLVGIFAATAVEVPQQAAFNIEQVTPGAVNVIARLGAGNRTTVIAGPGTFRVRRPLYEGAAFGVFLET